MMLSRRALLAGAAPLALAGCVTVGPLPNVGGLDIATIIARAQEIAGQICAYVPTGATIGGIIATIVGLFAPGAGTIEAVAAKAAQAFCDAINKKTSEGFRPRRAVSRRGEHVIDFGVGYFGGQAVQLQAYPPR